MESSGVDLSRCFLADMAQLISILHDPFRPASRRGTPSPTPPTGWRLFGKRRFRRTEICVARTSAGMPNTPAEYHPPHTPHSLKPNDSLFTTTVMPIIIVDHHPVHPHLAPGAGQMFSRVRARPPTLSQMARTPSEPGPPRKLRAVSPVSGFSCPGIDGESLTDNNR